MDCHRNFEIHQTRGEAINTVEPLIAATFTAEVRWPLLGDGHYLEVYYKYGKAFGTEG